MLQRVLGRQLCLQIPEVERVRVRDDVVLEHRAAIRSVRSVPVKAGEGFEFSRHRHHSRKQNSTQQLTPPKYHEVTTLCSVQELAHNLALVRVAEQDERGGTQRRQHQIAQSFLPPAP